jgi:hypothetical protein
MNNNDHRECYGGMFPDPLHPQNDRRLKGNVFSYLLTTAGGFVRNDRTVAVDVAQWDDCRACPEFTHCYPLCLGRLALQAAVVSE